MNTSLDDLLAFSSQPAVPYTYVFSVVIMFFSLQGNILKSSRGRKLYRFAHITLSIQQQINYFFLNRCFKNIESTEIPIESYIKY